MIYQSIEARCDGTHLYSQHLESRRITNSLRPDWATQVIKAGLNYMARPVTENVKCYLDSNIYNCKSISFYAYVDVCTKDFEKEKKIRSGGYLMMLK